MYPCTYLLDDVAVSAAAKLRLDGLDGTVATCAGGSSCCDQMLIVAWHACNPATDGPPLIAEEVGHFNTGNADGQDIVAEAKFTMSVYMYSPVTDTCHKRMPRTFRRRSWLYAAHGRDQ